MSQMNLPRSGSNLSAPADGAAATEQSTLHVSFHRSVACQQALEILNCMQGRVVACDLTDATLVAEVSRELVASSGAVLCDNFSCGYYNPPSLQSCRVCRSRLANASPAKGVGGKVGIVIGEKGGGKGRPGGTGKLTGGKAGWKRAARDVQHYTRVLLGESGCDNALVFPRYVAVLKEQKKECFGTGEGPREFLTMTEWVCLSCQHPNWSTHVVCTMCAAPSCRYGPSPLVAGAAGSTNYAAPPDIQQQPPAVASSSRGASKGQGSNSQPRSGEKSSTWACAKCTYANQDTAVECEVCGSGRGEADLATAAPPGDEAIVVDVSDSPVLKKRMAEAEPVPPLQQLERTATDDFECPICCMSCAIFDTFDLQCCNTIVCVKCAQMHIVVSIEDGKMPVPCLMQCKRPMTEAEADAARMKRTTSTGTVIDGEEATGAQALVVNYIPQNAALSVLNEQQRDKYLVLEQRHLQNQEGYEFCRAPGCMGTVAVEDFPAPGHFVCNVDRKHQYCINCSVEWHEGSTCAQYQEWAKTNGKAEEMTSSMLRRAGWARCPKCKEGVELQDGCNAIRCRCGINFCYLCGAMDKRDMHPHFNKRNTPCYNKLFSKKKGRNSDGEEVAPPPPPPPPRPARAPPRRRAGRKRGR